MGKYLALGHGTRTSLHSVHTVYHDLGPNIFLSGPPTESISTYSPVNFCLFPERALSFHNNPAVTLHYSPATPIIL